MIIIKRAFLFSLILLFSGCTDTMGIPTPHANKGEVYFFPEIGVVTKVYFDQGVYLSEQKEVYAQYRIYMYDKVEQSRYFLDVSKEKRPYMMTIEYHIYTYTSFTDTFFTVLGSPVAALFGPDYELNADMKVTVSYQGKVLESYHYEADFTSKYKNIQPVAKKYLDSFIQNLWKEMASRSKMKRIKKSI